MDKNPGQLQSICIYLLITAAIFAAALFLTHSNAKYINNAADLNRFNFSQGLAVISPNAFTQEGTDRYATYRLLLTNLSPGRIYGISGYSATHAMRLWVNGEILIEVGVPGDSYENMTAGTAYFTAYFVASAEPTEIIIQRSGFVLAHGGRLNALYFGEQHHITTRLALSHVRVSFLAGITTMAALLNLGIFLFFKNQMRFLWFALYCFMIAMRTIGIDNRLIATLVPGMDWQIDYLIAYLFTTGMSVSLTLYLNAMFSGELNKRFLQIMLGLLGVHAVFMLLSTPDVYSRFNTVYNVTTVLIIVGLIINMIWAMKIDKQKRHLEYVLIISGAGANFLLGMAEVVIRAVTPQAVVNYTQAGNIVFIFINTIALALYFKRTEAELAQANKQRRKDELQRQRIITQNTTLETLSRMKTEFLATVSHELKTPLGIISNNAQLARFHSEEAVSKDVYITDKMFRITSETERMAIMVNQLLDITRIEEGRMSMNFAPVDSVALIQDTMNTFYPVLNKNNNELTLNLPKGPSYSVYCDRERIRQVLLNLVANANRFTREGIITISASAENKDGFIHISVADTGEGIPKERIGSIFDRYTTAKPKSDKNPSGTGLGLYISKHIIEAHGGSITVSSEKGKGTIMTFTLKIGGN